MHIELKSYVSNALKYNDQACLNKIKSKSKETEHITTKCVVHEEIRP